MEERGSGAAEGGLPLVEQRDWAADPACEEAAHARAGPGPGPSAVVAAPTQADPATRTRSRPGAGRVVLDGDQVLDFHWIDPIEAAKRFISRPKFKGKLYTQYERQNSTQRPGKRAFGRANAGLVFQTCQAVDKYSSPLLLLFYADKSFSGKHRTHHPIYSECLFCWKSISKPI